MTILFVLVFIFLILTFARQAWYYGVLVQYWGIFGLAGGMGAGYLFFQFFATTLQRLTPDQHLPLGLNVFVSVAVGLIVYFIVRSIAAYALNNWFGPDSSLIDWTDGVRGASLSLLPSVITVAILASGLRLGGTLMELRHLEYICRPRVNFVASKYPGWPVWVKWRDSVEAIPVLTGALNAMDPISRVQERRIVCLLVASKKPELLTYFKSEPETAPIFDSSSMQDTMDSDEIVSLLKKFHYVALIKHPLVHQVAHDPDVAKALADLELRRLIDGFMLAPERQELIKQERI